MIHEVVKFLGCIPLTRCGIYVDSDKVTAYPAEVECKNCKRAGHWKW